jgi:hypothetical protein
MSWEEDGCNQFSHTPFGLALGSVVNKFQQLKIALNKGFT